MSAVPGKVPVPGPGGLHLRRWNDRAVVGVAVAAFASGFGQFGVVAALGDVARGFGQVNHGATLADQAGLSGTDLGIGLAIMRLASLGALPVTGLADRFGRRMLLLVTGRRLTGALAMVAVALCATVTYTGSAPALLAGYILGVFAASVFAPAAGSLVNELFPTPVRASVAGWSLAAGVLGAVTGLVAFGAVAAPATGSR